MYVPDGIRECVAYVTCRRNGELEVIGTAWFVTVPLTDKSVPGGWMVTVTAQHLINFIRAKSDDSMVVLRMNQTAGGLGESESHVDRWFTHDDPSVDVAVLLGAPINERDHKLFPADWFAVDLEASDVSLGDEVFIVGLFNRHYGSSRNEPIIRVGNVAAVPTEKVNTKLGPMECILIEARSTGGLSGSPVFLNRGPFRDHGRSLAVGPLPTPLLVGLVHGHFDDDSERAQSVNTGIAIVVPARRIKEVIDQAVAVGPQSIAKIVIRTPPSPPDGAS